MPSIGRVVWFPYLLEIDLFCPGSELSCTYFG